MTKIEARTDKILGSLSPKELLLVHIAQALTFDSDDEYLSRSDERIAEESAQRAKVFSAFISRINKRYLPVVADTKIRDAFFEASFLWRLWEGCNLYVDDAIKELRPRVRPLAEQQLRALLELKYMKSTGYKGGAEELLGDLLRPQFTIAAIRGKYFESKPILFKPHANELGRLVAAAEDAAQVHNTIDDLERAMSGQDRLSRVDVATVNLAATNDSQTLVDSLVRKAKSRARADERLTVGETKMVLSGLRHLL